MGHAVDAGCGPGLPARELPEAPAFALQRLKDECGFSDRAAEEQRSASSSLEARPLMPPDARGADLPGARGLPGANCKGAKKIVGGSAVELHPKQIP
eukprot:1684458-Pyramimonas_sp.AAC.1